MVKKVKISILNYYNGVLKKYVKNVVFENNIVFNFIKRIVFTYVKNINYKIENLKIKSINQEY